MAEFKLPDVGEGLTEAEIVSWKVKVGDAIEINDIIVEIETAKSLVELPSPYAGTVLALLVPRARPSPSARRSSRSATRPRRRRPRPPPRRPRLAEMEIDLSNPAASGGGEGESLVGRNKADRGPQRRARKGAAHAGDRGRRRDPDCSSRAPSRPAAPGPRTSSRPTSRPVPATSARTEPGPRRRRWCRPRPPSPARSGRWPSRRCASWPRTSASTSRCSGPPARTAPCHREPTSRPRGGSGAPAGSGATPRPAPARPVDGGERETREPIKGVRKMMAPAMVDSAFTAPHVTEWITVDVTRTMEFVDRLKARREFRDVKVSPLLVLSRAVMLAMRRTPEINSFWDEAAQEVVYKHYVNLGIAAATPRGLVVPNVKDAQDLSLLELAGALNQLTATAREGKTQPAEMSGGTFTITNVGVFGVDAGTPIINPGESAILCFGAIRKQPWVVTGPTGEDELGDPPAHHAGAVLRPPPHRRREGLALPRRRRRHPRGPGVRAAVLRLQESLGT